MHMCVHACTCPETRSFYPNPLMEAEEAGYHLLGGALSSFTLLSLTDAAMDSFTLGVAVRRSLTPQAWLRAPRRHWRLAPNSTADLRRSMTSRKRHKSILCPWQQNIPDKIEGGTKFKLVVLSIFNVSGEYLRFRHTLMDTSNQSELILWAFREK